MTPWLAAFISDRTADGHWQLLPGGRYKVGDTIEVDLDSRKLRECEAGGEKWTCETVTVLPHVDWKGPDMYVPTEMLEL